MDVTYAFPICGNCPTDRSSARSIGELGSSGLHSPSPGLSVPADSSCRRGPPTNLQIAAEFDCNRHTVGLWRDRYVAKGLAGLQDAPRSGRPRSFSPSERLDLINLASSTTEQQDCPATRWRLDELAATIINQTAHALAMSRSTIWRTLDEADLKPHRSVYWLNSHDPDFDAKAQAICGLYLAAPVMYQQGRLVICCDEKTGMQIGPPATHATG